MTAANPMSFGKTPYDLATKKFKKYLRSNAKRLLSHDHRVIEGMYKAKDGHKVPILIHGNTLRDENGRQLGHVGFVTDLTEQKRSLMVAGDVQRNLMPQPPPRIKGLDIAGNSVPCDEIGGDYYDFIETNADKTAATILNEVFQEVYRFIGSSKTEDDITLVIVKISDHQRS